MKAYVLWSAAEGSALGEMPAPKPPGPGEVRIRVRRSSINPSDAMMGQGFFRWLEHRYPAVLGRDLAGTVAEVGDGVTVLAPGDEVFGFVKRDYVGDGTFAEYVTIPADQYVVPRPASLPVADAGALGVAGTTALLCLDTLACRPGETVFVNGATGGVGAFAVQLAHRAGLRVLATAHGEAAEQHLSALGADATVDWTTGDIAEQVRSLEPGGVHGVVDLVSADAGAAAALGTAVSVTGRVVASTRAASEGPVRGVHCAPEPDLLRRLADAGLVVPLVDSYPLGGIDDAFAALARAPLGKIGLEIG